MKIALSAIVKDDSELDSLLRMVDSAKDYVDGVYITANGKEVSKVEEACKTNGWNYSYLPWNKDFSEQRNFNFWQVPAEYDYIFWMDADDVLVGGEYLREIAQRGLDNDFDVVFFSYWYGCLFNGEPSEETLEDVEISQIRERLIKPGSVIWKKRLHETPIRLPGYDFKATKHKYDEKMPLAVLHLGAARDLDQTHIKEKMQRNREILELELEDEKKEGKLDPRTQLYLMKIYAELEEPELWGKCIEMGHAYLEKSGWDEERATALLIMARCHGFLGDDQTPVKLLHQALIEDPYKPVIYLRLAEAYFNLGMYDKMYHWLETAMKIDNDRPTIMDNILETKVLASELLLKYYFNANRNTRKAYKASKELYKLNPTENNAKNVTYLEDLANMDIACEHLDKFWQYLESIGEEKAVLGTLQSLPQAIAKLPFVKKRHQKYGSPRVWQANEICYFANFGNAHFEKWDPSNLESGIGGSETAVIRLSQEWTKMGYKVTVYGDPHKVGYHDGVRYLPWYEFNAKDKFNIFIQWRNGGLANKISAKKFYVDLHDIYHQNDLIKIKDSIDQIMVKSKYHRDIAPDISNMKIVSNGI